MDSEQEHAPMYGRAERLRFALLGLAAGLLLVVVRTHWILPGLRHWIAWAPGRSVLGIPALSLLWYGLFAGLPASVTLILALTVGRRGVHILKEGQVPLRGEKVFHPTPIRRGRAAALIGGLHLALPGLMALAMIWGLRQARHLAAVQPPAADRRSSDSRPAAPARP